MPLDAKFLGAVDPLLVPVMGTETMAPLLYNLMRFLRPKVVVEGGMGYTTPFFAEALRDNLSDFERDRQRLREKNRAYVDDIDAGRVAADAGADEPTARGLDGLYKATNAFAKRRREWLATDPALANPAFYLEDHKPAFYCVDQYSQGDYCSATRVLPVVEALGLTPFVNCIEGDFWAPSTLEKLPSQIDFMWVDLMVNVESAVSLIDGPHWDRLSPGGFVAIHCMLTNTAGLKLFSFFKSQAVRGGKAKFEILGLLEPHKLMQSSCILIRKIVDWKQNAYEEACSANGEASFEADARALLAGAPKP
jgi:hypothetical protein